MRGKGQQKVVAAKAQRLVNAMTMMIKDEVETGFGHWCVMLVYERQNHNAMTERAGSGSGAQVWKLVKGHLWQRKNFLVTKVVEEVKSRGRQKFKRGEVQAYHMHARRSKRRTSEEQRQGSSYTYVEIEVDQGYQDAGDDYRMMQGLKIRENSLDGRKRDGEDRAKEKKQPQSKRGATDGVSLRR